MSLASQNNMEAPVVSGVTLDRDVTKITLQNLPFENRTISGIFGAIAEAGANVDIIVHNLVDTEAKTMTLGFTTSRGESEMAIGAANRYWSTQFPGQKLQITTETDLAKVSVVGVGMRSHPGVAATTFSALSSLGVGIRMISTSEIKISCVIDASRSEEACQALHKAFIE